MSISVKDIAWVAGILEGEASFTTSGRYNYPGISLEMTDLDIVERVRTIVDPLGIVGVYERNREGFTKPSYRLSLNGTRAIQWMMTIYPLMSLRRKTKIRELLHYWKSLKPKKQVSVFAENVKLIMMARKVSREEAEKIFLETLMEK